MVEEEGDKVVEDEEEGDKAVVEEGLGVLTRSSFTNETLRTLRLQP